MAEIRFGAGNDVQLTGDAKDGGWGEGAEAQERESSRVNPLVLLALREIAAKQIIHRRRNSTLVLK